MGVPTDLDDATGINEETGKFLSCNTSKTTLPTKPVTPTTANFMF
jgi:hypothetical protein